MATNPDQVLGPTPERLAADQARARQLADFRALVAEGRAKMREAVNSRQATFDQLNEIAQAYGMKPLTDRAAVESSLAFAANPENDPNRVQILTEAITPEGDSVPTGEVAIAVQPEAAAPTLAPSALEAMAQSYRDFYNQPGEDVGLDRATLRMFGAEPGNTQGLMGLINSILLAPVSLGRAAIEQYQAGVPALFTGIGQGLENIDIGGRSGLQRLGGAMMPGVKPSVENFAGGMTEFTDIAGLMAGGSPMPPVSLGTLRRMRNLPPTPPSAVEAAIARANAAAPEVPPVAPARAAAAAPEVPTPPRVPPEQRAIDRINVDELSPSQSQKILSPASHEEITDFLGDYGKILIEQGFARPKNMPQSEWLQAHILDDTIPQEQLVDIMAKHNVTSPEDFLRAAGLSRETLSRAGVELNRASQLNRYFLRLAAENPDAAMELGVAKKAVRQARGMHHRLMSIESALLTNQMVTIARNVSGATPIMPTYTLLEELTDAGIRAVRNRNRAPEDQFMGPSAKDALYTWMDHTMIPLAEFIYKTANVPSGTLSAAGRFAGKRGMGRAEELLGRGGRALQVPEVVNLPIARKLGETLAEKRARSRRVFEELRNAFPDRHSKLLGRYSSDQVMRGPTDTKFNKAVGAVEQVVDMTHVASQFMDRLVKNVQFPGFLDMELRRIGRSLDEVFDNNSFDTIPKETLDAAIRRMHKRVFEDRPDSNEWYDQRARAFIDLTNTFVRPFGLAPFPNFMVSYGKHVIEHSPAAVVRFASEAEKAKIRKGDHRAIGKIAAGLIGTLAAYTLKDYDDGTEWYEIRTPDGDIADVKASAAPMLANMWQAYLFEKFRTGRQNEIQWSRDLAMIAGSSSLRSGFSGYAVDQGFREIIDAAQAGTGEEAIKKMVYEYMARRLGSWTLFFRQFRDAAVGSGIDPNATSYSPESPLQATAGNLPFGISAYESLTGQEVPERFSVTREGPLQDQDPLLRQVTGALFRGQRNPLEERMVDLSMTPREVRGPNGPTPTYDRLFAEELGRLASQNLVPNFEEIVPTTLSPEEQRIKIRDEYTDLRADARRNILRRYPIYDFARDYFRMPRDERRLRDQANIANPQRGRSARDFFMEVEQVDPAMPVITGQDYWREVDLEELAPGTRYADLLTYTIETKE